MNPEIWKNQKLSVSQTDKFFCFQKEFEMFDKTNSIHELKKRNSSVRIGCHSHKFFY